MADVIKHSPPLNKNNRFYLSSETKNEYPPSSEHLTKVAPVPVSSSECLARTTEQSSTSIPARSESSAEHSPDFSPGKYFAIPIGCAVDSTPKRISTQAEDTGRNQFKPMSLLSSALKGNMVVNTTSVWSSSSSSNASSSDLRREAKENRLQSATQAPVYIPPQDEPTNDDCYNNDGYYNDGYQGRYQERKGETQYDQQAATSNYAVTFNYGYPEFPPNTQHIIRGGFSKLIEDEQDKPKRPKIGEFFTAFPPAMNKDYELTTDARDPKFVYTPPKLVFSSRRPSVAYQPIHLFPVKQLGIEAQEKAHNDLWNDKAIRLLGLGFPDARGLEERVAMYKKAFNIEKDSFGYCWRCKEHHIEFGPPETLPDRDTCGAYLPAWYPAHHVTNCWELFRDLWKDIIYREETGRHFDNSRPRRPIWDKEYHEPDNKWKALGHNTGEGWWKCRNGPGATDAELSCVVCHRNRPAVQDDPTQRLFATKKNALVEWVHGNLRQMGVDDRPSAEGIVERMGSVKVLNMPYFAPNDQRRGFKPPRLVPEHMNMSPSTLDIKLDHKTAALEVLRQMPYPAILGKTYKPIPPGLARCCTYSSMNSEHPPANLKSYWDDGDPPTPAQNHSPNINAKPSCRAGKGEDDKQWETEDEDASESGGKSCASTISQFALGSPVRPVRRPSSLKKAGPSQHGDAAARGGGDLLLTFPFAPRTSPTRMSRLN